MHKFLSTRHKRLDLLWNRVIKKGMKYFQMKSSSIVITTIHNKFKRLKN